MTVASKWQSLLIDIYCCWGPTAHGDFKGWSERHCSARLGQVEFHLNFLRTQNEWTSLNFLGPRDLSRVTNSVISGLNFICGAVQLHFALTVQTWGRWQQGRVQAYPADDQDDTWHGGRQMEIRQELGTWEGSISTSHLFGSIAEFVYGKVGYSCFTSVIRQACLFVLVFTVVTCCINGRSLNEMCLLSTCFGIVLSSYIYIYIYIERERERTHRICIVASLHFFRHSINIEMLSIFFPFAIPHGKETLCFPALLEWLLQQILWHCAYVCSANQWNAHTHTHLETVPFPPSPSPPSPKPIVHKRVPQSSQQAHSPFFSFPSGSLSGHLTVANTHNQKLRYHVASGKTVTVSTSVCPTMGFFK